MSIKILLHDVFEKAYIEPKRKRMQSLKIIQKINKKPLQNNIITENGTKLGLSKKHIKILKNCNPESTAKELMHVIEASNLTKFRNTYLNKLIDKKFIECVNPKIIKRKCKIVARDELGNVLRNKDGKMLYIDKLDENGEQEFKECFAPNPQQKYKLTTKFVRNKM